MVDFWTYKYSRHPQYLGFILWSYSLLIFVSSKTYVRGAFTTPPALIWLISSMLIIGIALFEMLEMRIKI
ncbi:MAG: isoprenylcysteine carboxylmethyltransferase family protein [Acidilobaceae archaeon]